ncbi:MAG: CheY-P-specific phosphatase CheC [Desulfuromonadaceae bacterium GWC2_58_13]|nr:MAG: CheY-P-specific phosphatase CheC [Desulfuromonadaceae bacterium GWC2_58_13]
MTLPPLSETQLDALKEISNIGMGHAATALSQMIGETVYLRVPRITIADITEMPDLVGGPEEVVVGITLRIFGDARGTILLIFPRESAQQMLVRLIGHKPRGLVFNEMSASALKELGNILASAYLSALGNLLHMTLIPSIPLLAYDMAGAVLDNVLIELSQVGDLALMVETEFHDQSPSEDVIRGHFMILPDPGTLDVILEAARGGHDG